MIINGPSHYQYKLPRRPVGLQEKFGFGTFLAFFTTKVIRGGPRILLHLITAVVLLLLVLKVVPQGYIRYNLWSWHKTESGDNSNDSGSGTANDGSVPGGLRIVVFGGHDVATPGRTPGPEYLDMDKRSWTELLCAELECSSYLSFVPTDAPSHTMTSNRLYAASIDRVRNATAWSSGPGMDYSFLPAKYPVPWDIPDLEEQVTTFLSMPKPQNSPGQTLWVFSFGMWDIWSLASEPRELSIPIVDAMVSQMLTEVERIYQSALNESSIAWSNPSQRLRGAALNKTASAGSPVPSTTEHFRILMPKLFDPSLTPGWQTGRPDLPAVHSKAEQMRNAAALTNHWNQQLNNFMFRWVRTVDQMPKVDGEVDPPATYAGRKKVLTGKEAMAAYAASLQESKAKPNPKVGLKLDGSERKRPVKLPQPVQPREVLEVAPEPKAEGIVVVIQEEEPETTPQPDPIQLLQRDGIMYELNEYLADLIVDRQFRNTGLTDGLGVGTKPTQDGFLEVRKPCTEDLPNGVANHAGDRESEQPAIRGRAPVPSNSALPPNASRLRICEAPQEHLFFTPFTVSPRAIRMIARRAADMVRRNETARAQMAKQYLVPVGQPPIKKPHGGGTPVGS